MNRPEFLSVVFFVLPTLFFESGKKTYFQFYFLCCSDTKLTPSYCRKKGKINGLYSKTCVKRTFSRRQKIGFQDQLSFNAGQKYCRMLQGEHSAIH